MFQSSRHLSFRRGTCSTRNVLRHQKVAESWCHAAFVLWWKRVCRDRFSQVIPLTPRRSLTYLGHVLLVSTALDIKIGAEVWLDSIDDLLQHLIRVGVVPRRRHEHFFDLARDSLEHVGVRQDLRE